MSTFDRMIAIRNRYFRSVTNCPEGHLGHHGDCHVFLPIEIHNYAPCDCGFNHDLRSLGYELALKLNPDFENDMRLQEIGINFVQLTPENKLNDKLFTNEILNSLINEDYTPRIEEDEEDDWDQIALAFGKEFTSQLRNRVHNFECPICGWTWNSRIDNACSYCKSLEDYQKNLIELV